MKLSIETITKTIDSNYNYHYNSFFYVYMFMNENNYFHEFKLTNNISLKYIDLHTDVLFQKILQSCFARLKGIFKN